jgi:hypothetical protein
MIMKRLLPLLGALALGAAFATPALADGRVHFGISVGVPAYYPYVKHCPGGWQRVAP